MTTPQRGRQGAVAPDRTIVASLWLVLVVAVISLFPFTTYSTFLVPIAQSTGTQESLVGALRGLGGVAAFAVGVALAPQVSRWPRSRTVALSLVLLAASCVAATLGSTTGIVVFCAGVGAATALLTPALLTIATTTFSRPDDAGRAATIVTATQSLAAVLAGPVIGVVGWWVGWVGALWVTAALATLGAVAFLRSGDDPDGQEGAQPSYGEAFRAIAARPGLPALVCIAALRTTSFMGYLALLAAHFHGRFGVDAVTFTLVWTLSGLSFFLGNYLAGRWVRRARRVRAVLLAGLVTSSLAVVVVFTSPVVPVALAGTVPMGVSHAVVAAQVTTAIARRAGPVTGTAFSITAAGMSLGVFAGGTIGGAGYALAGSTGLGLALLAPTLLALALVPRVRDDAGPGAHDGPVVDPR